MKLKPDYTICHFRLGDYAVLNNIDDIENLLSMVTKKDPLDEGNFSQMITNTESRHDYFRYRISHYENEVGSIFFPKKIQEYIPLVMDEGELKKYNDYLIELIAEIYNGSYKY